MFSRLNVSQGSTIGSLTFILYLNDFSSAITVHPVIFVDETNLCDGDFIVIYDWHLYIYIPIRIEN